MGEVGNANDVKFNPKVATNILPDVFASDPDRMAPLQPEARALATFRHF